MKKYKEVVGEVRPKMTKEEYANFLEKYKALNPAKYAKKLAEGHFEKYPIKVVEKVTEKVEEEPQPVAKPLGNKTKKS